VIGALIGLLADRDGVALAMASWGAGTRRMAALEIAAATQADTSITVIDEIERGLEPYRLRQLIGILKTTFGQCFVTTHSPVAIQCAHWAKPSFRRNASHNQYRDWRPIAAASSDRRGPSRDDRRQGLCDHCIVPAADPIPAPVKVGIEGALASGSSLKYPDFRTERPVQGNVDF
jgi:AAA domain, putative AbiEii toxin, Type IV TA system